MGFGHLILGDIGDVFLMVLGARFLMGRVMDFLSRISDLWAESAEF